MGYWGWRPLIFGLFISAWVAGCNIVTDHTAPSAAPNLYPNVTLTVGRLPTARVSAAPTRAAPTRMVTAEASPSPAQYSVQPGDTWASIAQAFHISLSALQNANSAVSTLVAGESLLIPALTPAPVTLHAPTCYETRPGNLLCLGRVDNPLNFPVDGVAVEVNLLQTDGSVFLRQRATLEQMIIPPSSFAPYQVTFAAGWNDFSAVEASLLSAQQSMDDRLVMLLIQDVKGEQVDGRIIVSAVVYNSSSENAEILRVFVTLLDESGRVIGYRVVSFDAGMILSAGAQLPVSIDVTPQISDVTPEYSLYVEARAVED